MMHLFAMPQTVGNVSMLFRPYRFTRRKTEHTNLVERSAFLAFGRGQQHETVDDLGIQNIFGLGPIQRLFPDRLSRRCIQADNPGVFDDVRHRDAIGWMLNTGFAETFDEQDPGSFFIHRNGTVGQHPLA